MNKIFLVGVILLIVLAGVLKCEGVIADEGVSADYWFYDSFGDSAKWYIGESSYNISSNDGVRVIITGFKTVIDSVWAVKDNDTEKTIYIDEPSYYMWYNTFKLRYSIGLFNVRIRHYLKLRIDGEAYRIELIKEN